MALIKEKKIKLICGTELTLRSPVKTDAQPLVDFCTEIFATSDYVITQPDEYEANCEKQEAWIKNFDNSTGSVCIIAEIDKKVIGNIDFRNNPDRKRIKHRGEFGMSVLKEWRGKGLGKILIAELISWAKLPSNPIEKIELVVIEENEPALRLYKSLGFKEEGRIYREFKLSDDTYLDGISMGLWVG